MTPSTDGKTIPLPGINDYAGEILKAERSDFDASGTLNVIRVCTSNQGGLLDNPGLVTQACGNVLDKWDQVWREKEGDLICSNSVVGSDGAAYSDIQPCELPVPPGEGGHDNQAFFDTIEESADKLWIHTNDLSSKCLQKGESKVSNEHSYTKTKSTIESAIYNPIIHYSYSLL